MTSRERRRVTRRISHLPFIPRYIAKKKKEGEAAKSDFLSANSPRLRPHISSIIFTLKVYLTTSHLAWLRHSAHLSMAHILTRSRVYVLHLNPLRLIFIILNVFLFKYICLTWSSPELYRSPPNVIRPIDVTRQMPGSSARVTTQGSSLTNNYDARKM